MIFLYNPWFYIKKLAEGPGVATEKKLLKKNVEENF